MSVSAGGFNDRNFASYGAFRIANSKVVVASCNRHNGTTKIFLKLQNYKCVVKVWRGSDPVFNNFKQAETIILSKIFSQKQPEKML